MYYSVIFGSDLSAFLKKSKEYQNLVPKIDPNGSNVVELSLLHNDVEIRAIMLIKLIDNDVPLRTVLDFPIDIYNKMAQKVWYEENAPSN